VLRATRAQRNEFVSDLMKKPTRLEQVPRGLIVRFWENNHGVPGWKEDYLPGGKFIVQEQQLSSHQPRPSREKTLPSILALSLEAFVPMR